MAYRTVDSPRPDVAARCGTLVSVEGLWGAGKTTLARRLGERLEAGGFSTTVMHYGPRHGVIGCLSRFLEEQPLRSRTGTGGYAAPHHATVDVLLRLCREAYHHTRLYAPALREHDVVVLDHGVYSKLAYSLAVLTETRPGDAAGELLAQVQECVEPWFLHPQLALFLDVPWPLARERAIKRASGGGNPGSVERLMFLPGFDAAYRTVLAAYPERTRRVRVGLRGVDDVLAAVLVAVRAVLRAPLEEGAGNA